MLQKRAWSLMTWLSGRASMFPWIPQHVSAHGCYLEFLCDAASRPMRSVSAAYATRFLVYLPCIEKLTANATRVLFTGPAIPVCNGSVAFGGAQVTFEITR